MTAEKDCEPVRSGMATPSDPVLSGTSTPFDPVLSGTTTPSALDGCFSSGYMSPDTEKQTAHGVLSPGSVTECRTAPQPLLCHWNSPKINIYRILSCCLQFFATGIHDSAQGALIPYYETHYNVTYAIVSLSFVTNALGVILAAFLTDPLIRKLGRSNTLLMSEICLVGGSVIGACAPPFPVLLIGFFLIGIGCGMMLAVQNVFAANLVESSVVLGICHGTYGVGGLVGPLIATSMIGAGLVWQRFYIVPGSMRVLSGLVAVVSYRGYEDEPAQLLQAALEKAAAEENQRVREQEALESGEKQKKPPSNYALALKMPVTLVAAAFIFAYQAAEVSISGWIISFLIDSRGGEPLRVGYITSGFWGGVTLGRFFLTAALKPIGEVRAVYILTILAIAFQLMTWLIPSWVSVAVTVSIIGLLIGPIYPFATTTFVGRIDPSLHTVAIGFIASAGSSGGALGPFGIGALAGWRGVWVMHPVILGLYAIMLLCWFFLPGTPQPEFLESSTAEEVEKIEKTDGKESDIEKMENRLNVQLDPVEKQSRLRRAKMQFRRLGCWE